MSGKRRRHRLSKKEYEQLERKEAQRESEARSESEARQERIKVLWDAITSGRTCDQDAKDLADNELVRSLVELAGLQDREIKYLVKFRRDWEEIDAHYPERLKNLSFMSFRAAWEPLFKTLPRKSQRKHGNASKADMPLDRRRCWSNRIRIWRCRRSLSGETLAAAWSARLGL